MASIVVDMIDSLCYQYAQYVWNNLMREEVGENNRYGCLQLENYIKNNMNNETEIEELLKPIIKEKKNLHSEKLTRYFYEKQLEALSQYIVKYYGTIDDFVSVEQKRYPDILSNLIIDISYKFPLPSEYLCFFSWEVKMATLEIVEGTPIFTAGISLEPFYCCRTKIKIITETNIGTNDFNLLLTDDEHMSTTNVIISAGTSVGTIFLVDDMIMKKRIIDDDVCLISYNEGDKISFYNIPDRSIAL